MTEGRREDECRGGQTGEMVARASVQSDHRQPHEWAGAFWSSSAGNCGPESTEREVKKVKP